jgi:hypothetical protein
MDLEQAIPYGSVHAVAWEVRKAAIINKTKVK